MTLDLPLIWFLLIAVLWTGYLILEGFDFGVGMLLPILGKGVDPAHTDKRRRVLLNTIGPVWDGNEVWILTAGGATFAAFPEWYATLFSGFYLPLLLILVALIIRNMGFDYRGKRADATWAARWDLAIIIGSFLPALLTRRSSDLTNIVHGVPLNADHEYTGTLLTLLNPLALLGGIVTTGLFLTHGALFLTLKTDGGIRHDARAFATKAGLTTAVLAVILLGWLGLTKGTTASWATTVIAATTLLAAIYLNTKRREGYAFTATAITIAATVATYFLMLYPNVMPSTTNPNYSLTITNASSTPYTLKIMTIAALVFTPIVLIYQSWTYWTFRKRLTTHHIPVAQDPSRDHAATHGLGR